MTVDTSAIVGVIVVALAFAAARQAAIRKGRTLAWGFVAFFFPPALLILELLPATNPPPAGTPGNLVLEWVATFAVAVTTAVICLSVR